MQSQTVDETKSSNNSKVQIICFLHKIYVYYITILKILQFLFLAELKSSAQHRSMGI